MERSRGQREASGEQRSGAAEGCAGTSSPGPPSREQRSGPAEGRAGTSSTAPPSLEQRSGAADGCAGTSSDDPPSGEQRSGPAEGRAGISSSAPMSGEQRGAGESRSAASGTERKGKIFVASPSSGSNRNEQDLCKNEVNQSSIGVCPTGFKKRQIDLQVRRPSLIKVLRQDACASSRRRVRDSIDISCRRRLRPRCRKIKWQSILRGWPDEAENCPHDTPLGHKIARKDRHSGKKNKWIEDPAAKIQISCHGRTSSRRIKEPAGKLRSSPTKRIIVLVRATADLNRRDPGKTRVLLPNDMSGNDLDALFKQVVQRGFKKFVNNSAFQRALLRRVCSIYDAEVRGRNSRV